MGVRQAARARQRRHDRERRSRHKGGRPQGPPGIMVSAGLTVQLIVVAVISGFSTGLSGFGARAQAGRVCARPRLTCCRVYPSQGGESCFNWAGCLYLS